MKKLIFTVIILSIADFSAYYYLKYIFINKKPLEINIKENNLIYQKKDLIFDEIDSFDINDYFELIGNFKYSIDDSNIIISNNESNYTFPYTIKEKEVQETIVYVQKPIYQTVYIEKHQEETNYIPKESSYINANSSYTFNVDTDINNIVNTILSSVDTNIPVSLDYSFLNPNEKGIYTVFLNSELGSKAINVSII